MSTSSRLVATTCAIMALATVVDAQTPAVFNCATRTGGIFQGPGQPLLSSSSCATANFDNGSFTKYVVGSADYKRTYGSGATPSSTGGPSLPRWVTTVYTNGDLICYCQPNFSFTGVQAGKYGDYYVNVSVSNGIVKIKEYTSEKSPFWAWVEDSITATNPFGVQCNGSTIPTDAAVSDLTDMPDPCDSKHAPRISWDGTVSTGCVGSTISRPLPTESVVPMTSAWYKYGRDAVLEDPTGANPPTITRQYSEEWTPKPKWNVVTYDINANTGIGSVGVSYPGLQGEAPVVHTCHTEKNVETIVTDNQPENVGLPQIPMAENSDGNQIADCGESCNEYAFDLTPVNKVSKVIDFVDMDGFQPIKALLVSTDLDGNILEVNGFKKLSGPLPTDVAKAFQESDNAKARTSCQTTDPYLDTEVIDANGNKVEYDESSERFEVPELTPELQGAVAELEGLGGLAKKGWKWAKGAAKKAFVPKPQKWNYKDSKWSLGKDGTAGKDLLTEIAIKLITSYTLWITAYGKYGDTSIDLAHNTEHQKFCTSWAAVSSWLMNASYADDDSNSALFGAGATICAGYETEMDCEQVRRVKFGRTRQTALKCVRTLNAPSQQEIDRYNKLKQLYAKCPEKNPMSDPEKDVEKEVFIAFKGTQENIDWVSNLNFIPLRHKIGNTKHLVHAGFWNEFEIHRDVTTIKDMAEGFKKVTFLGHSRGGAIANIAAVHWKNEAPETDVRIITEGGAPPFTNEIRIDLVGILAQLIQSICSGFGIPFGCDMAFEFLAGLVGASNPVAVASNLHQKNFLDIPNLAYINQEQPCGKIRSPIRDFITYANPFAQHGNTTKFGFLTHRCSAKKIEGAKWYQKKYQDSWSWNDWNMDKYKPNFMDLHLALVYNHNAYLARPNSA